MRKISKTQTLIGTVAAITVIIVAIYISFPPYSPDERQHFAQMLQENITVEKAIVHVNGQGNSILEITAPDIEEEDVLAWFDNEDWIDQLQTFGFKKVIFRDDDQTWEKDIQ